LLAGLTGHLLLCATQVLDLIHPHQWPAQQRRRIAGEATQIAIDARWRIWS
jgi:hypothetical protein